MYWSPIDMNLLTKPETQITAGGTIKLYKEKCSDSEQRYDEAQFKYHYTGQWKQDKMHGKGCLFVRHSEGQSLNHTMYKISGIWSENVLDTSIDEITKNHRYYIVKVDREMNPISKGQSDIHKEVDIGTFVKVL